MLKTVSISSGGGGSSNITINTTSITGGTSGNVLYDNAGTVGEKSVTGTGNVVLSDSPTITTALTVTGALQLTGSDTVAQNIATTQTTGALNIGGASATGTTTIGQSTGSYTLTIGGGSTVSASTKTINISSLPATGGTRTVNIGTGNRLGGYTNINVGSTSFSATNYQTININPSFVQTPLNNTQLTGLYNPVAGMRAFVVDALAPAFGSLYTPGGSITVPVYYDGTNWYVG